MTSAVVSGLGRRVASRSHFVATSQQPAIASRVRLRNGQQQQQHHQHQLQQRRHASDHARRPKTALFFPGAWHPLDQHSLSPSSCNASHVSPIIDVTLDMPRN